MDVNLFLAAPLLLVCAHYVADFAMQSEFMALMKAKAHSDPHGWHALIAHSAHHALLSLLVVWWLTQSFGLGLVGFVVTGVTHGVIDYFKAVKEAFSVTADQVMHLSVAIGLGVAVAILG